MVINGDQLLLTSPIKNMFDSKVQHLGVSHGLAEVGYDIRIKQNISFYPKGANHLLEAGSAEIFYEEDHVLRTFQSRVDGRFCIASAIEEFDMPSDLMGIVHDKSTWARRGLSVFNTVIEPGWKGFLTLELVYHGQIELHLLAGSGIAQVVFHQIAESREYEGKYQNQANQPVEAIYHGV